MKVKCEITLELDSGDFELKVHNLTDPGKPIQGAADISGQVWLAWDATNLYIAGKVRDDDLNGFKPDVAHNVGPAGWYGDSVMFQFHSFRQRIKSNSPHQPLPMQQGV